MKLMFLCLFLLSTLLGLALWHHALLCDLTGQTEEALVKAYQLAEDGRLSEARQLLDEMSALWKSRQMLLQVFGDHATESEIRSSLARAAAYATQEDIPLFYGEAAVLSLLLEEIREADRPVLGSIL